MANPGATASSPLSGASRILLDLVNVEKSFDDFKAVSDVKLQVMENEFFTIVGPSGSGKTTLLRMLSGMDYPTGGDIVLRGESISDLPPDKRPTCMVFQALALFPHMSVGQNIEFPLKMRGVPVAERERRVYELMAMVRLPEEYYKKNVQKCSGGEKQRVAIARAFAYDPEILLFDEPLSAIDYRLRKTLEKELKALHRESGKTFIYITHSLEEAMVMSDRIGVMNKGRLVQVGAPSEIYSRPANKFVAEFMGETNAFPVRSDTMGGWRISLWPNRLFKVANNREKPAGFVIVRPESMRILENEQDADNALRGTVMNEYSLGSRVQYQVKAENQIILMELPHGVLEPDATGKDVLVGWNAADAVFVED